MYSYANDKIVTLTWLNFKVYIVWFFLQTGEKVLNWEMNTELKETLNAITTPRVSFIDVPIGNDFKARVKLTLPPSVDENSDIKYPMLVNT